MEMTQKAQQEIQKLNAKIANLGREMDRMIAHRGKAADHRSYQMYQREINKLSGQRYKAEDRVSEIERDGISSGERSALLREASGIGSKFATIGRSKSLGCTDYEKVGWSKALSTFVKVRFSRYNGFMRNVQGCASLADKTHLSAFEYLTEAEADALLQAGNKVETNFLGHEERTLPIDKVAADLKS